MYESEWSKVHRLLHIIFSWFLFSRYTITLIRRYLWTRKLGQSALSTTKQPVTIHDIRNFHTFLAGHSSRRETSPCSLSKDSSWTGEEDISLSYSRKKVFLIFVFIFFHFLYTSGSHLQGQDNIGFTWSCTVFFLFLMPRSREESLIFMPMFSFC